MGVRVARQGFGGWLAGLVWGRVVLARGVVAWVSDGARMVVLAAAVLLLWVLVGGVGSAAAAQFGSYGTAAGQFETPHGIAVDQKSVVEEESGDVYVLDSVGQRVEKWGAAGQFLLAWGWGVADGKTSALQTCTATCFPGLPGSGAGQIGGFAGAGSVAVDNDLLSLSHGDVYVVDQGNHRVEKFSSTGEFLLMFGGEVNSVTKGDVCLAAESANCKAGTAGPAPGQFEFPSIGSVIAVGATGTVYVGDVNRVEEFSPEGKYLSQVELPGTGSVLGLGVNSAGDLYVISSGVTGVSEYEPSGTLLHAIPVGNPRALTLDQLTGNIFIDDCAGEGSCVINHEVHRMLEYEAAAKQLESFDAGLEDGERGIAFAEKAGVLYVLNQTEAIPFAAHVRVLPLPPPGPLLVEGSESAGEIAPTTAVLHATINPEGTDTTYRFEYGETAAYGTSVPAVEPDIGSGFEGQPATVPLSGLSPRTLYHFRVVATNSSKETTFGPDQTVTTLPPALIESESVLNVASTSATLEATVNPLGSDTTYHFQYGPTTACGGTECSTPAPDVDIGNGTVGVTVTPLHLQGLSPSTVYHYRVLATNVLGVEEGEERSFTTEKASTSVLPDGRAWEMVSPPDKHGANLETQSEGGKVLQAAVAGNAISYIASAPTEPEPKGLSNSMQVLSRRGPGGWETQDIEIPHLEATGIAIGGAGGEYRFFSSDLSLAAVQPFGGFNPGLSSQASEQTPYLRSDYPPGNVNAPCTGSCYRPLVTGKAGFANVPEGRVFSTAGGCPHVVCGPTFGGATSDFSHVMVSSTVALTPTPIREAENRGALYEWSAGALQPVSLLPGEETEAVEGVLGNPKVGAREARAVSNDGSRVIWTAPGNGHLYMRDTVTGETVQLDAAQGSKGPGEVRPRFQAASVDGSRVFFTDQQRLTADAGAVHGEPDLYECVMVEEPGGLKCQLSDLTPLNAGEKGDVQGPVIGAGEDGSRVYFVADGVVGVNPGAVPGAPNLYVHEGGVTKLVVVLSPGDSPDWANGSENITGLAARVSAGGGWLVFMSDRSLTGYDNRDAVSGHLDEEVFLYNAVTRRISCVSCDPSGARPVGVETRGKGEQSLALGSDGVWPGGTWLAGSVPGWTTSLYQSRYLSDSGRVFFNATDALVPRDVNGTWDVYQYEPSGVGSCSMSSVTFSVVSGGCVGLISSGSSADESAFVDASESGGDVFFLTTEKLSPRDFDTSLDLYDAHECTGAAPCLSVPPVTPPACSTGDSCKAAPSVQPGIFGAPASATFAGVGNPPPPPPPRPLTRAQKLAKALGVCRRKKGRPRVVCERKARKAFAARRPGRVAVRGAKATKRSQG